MKHETILNVMIGAYYRAEKDWTIGPGLRSPQYKKHQRQYYAFRDRIIRMDAEKSIAIAAYKAVIEKHKEFDAEKDQRIAELEGELKAIRKACPEYIIRQNEKEYQKRLRGLSKKGEQ